VNLSQPGVTVGNPHLTPEQSTSYTLGFVWQPTFFKNFSLTVDYYNIDIKNAIIQPTGQEIVNNCVDGPSLDPAFCNLIQRQPSAGVNQDGQQENKGDIDFLTQSFLNSSRLFTDGIEVQSSYTTRVDPMHMKIGQDSEYPGRLSVNIDYNYLLHLHNFPFNTAPNTYIVEEGTLVPAGLEGTPYQRARADITYDQGRFSVTWTLRYVGRAADFARSPGQAVYAGNAIVPPYFGQELYNDVIVHYHTPVHTSDVDWFAGAQDLFNIQPPPGAITGNNGGPDGSALYDLGVYVFVGARVRY
jgi:iron complex outermembrane receptor protein